MGLIVPKALADEDIFLAAEKIRGISQQMSVTLVARQNVKDPTQMCLRCVLTENTSAAIESMESRGFTEGQASTVDIGICEGEEISISTAGNLTFETESSATSMKFFTSFESCEVVFKIREKEKRGTLLRGKYVGQLKYVVGDQTTFLFTKGEFVTYLPAVNILNVIPAHEFQYVCLYFSLRFCGRFFSIVYVRSPEDDCLSVKLPCQGI